MRRQNQILNSGGVKCATLSVHRSTVQTEHSTPTKATLKPPRSPRCRTGLHHRLVMRQALSDGIMQTG